MFSLQSFPGSVAAVLNCGEYTWENVESPPNVILALLPLMQRPAALICDPTNDNNIFERTNSASDKSVQITERFLDEKQS